VELLPLVQDVKGQFTPGWCTYETTLVDSPEVEIFCGGLNSKTPSAAGVWRQGNLLHFGFEPSPAALNENGRNMLVNSIVYIARFTEDRPIPHTPSPFGGKSIFARRGAEARLVAEDFRPENWTYRFAPAALQGLDLKDPAKCRAWYQEVRGFLHADREGHLVVDEDLRALGAANDSPEFFDSALTALGRGGEEQTRARRLLNRYAPEGPGADATAEAWRAWWKENRAYLFFCEMGDYHWYLDPLAKKRGVPSAELRGPARATVR
jgi:hypothetical protein